MPSIQPRKKGSKSDRLFLMLTVGASVVVSLAQLAPHTFLQTFTRDVVQHHTHGQYTRINLKTEQLVRKVMKDMELSKEELEVTTAFICYPTDGATLGSTSSLSGLALGLPLQVQTAEMDLSKLRLGSNKRLTEGEKSSEAAEWLKESANLSEDAKKFLVARELTRGREGLKKTLLAVESALIAAVAVNSCRFAKTTLSDTTLMASKPIKFAIYASILVTIAYVGLFVEDFQRWRHLGGFDRAAARLGPEYARGGVEYYDKFMLRNRALRALTGDSGAKDYTLKGDGVPSLIRPFRTRSLAMRKEECQNILNSMRISN